METEKCKIELDSPASIYYSGQEIKGSITIILLKKIKIRGIQFKVQGNGKCCWYEILRRESSGTPMQKVNQRSIIYTSNEVYLSSHSYIMGSKSARPVELDTGSHTYNFNFQLPAILPSSFTGTYGSIKYKLKFVIEKAWNFDDKYSVPITIVKNNPLYTLATPTTPILRQMTKNIGIFGGGPISLVAELPLYKVVRGGKLILRVTVDNKSNTHIDKLKFSIRQIVSYFSEQPMRIRREEIFKMYKKETGGVLKKTDRTFEHELQVPSCQPEDSTTSNIICIAYNIQVEVVLPGLYKNISIRLPFAICSHEINEAPPRGIDCAFPSPNTSAYSFPSIDYSNASPSHSYASDSSPLPIADYSGSSRSPSYSLPIIPNAGRSPQSMLMNRQQSDVSAISEPMYVIPNTRSGNSSNRSSLSEYSFDPRYSHSYPTYPTSMPGTSRAQNYPEESPPSYSELFGAAPQVPQKFPSAPPIDMVNK